MEPVVVVGAGIAGVACAAELVRAQVPVRVVDRGRRMGGRLASRRLDDRPVDLGASYLTATQDGDFAKVVDRWRTRGLAFPWTDTFVALDASAGGADGRPSAEVKTGPVRWGATGGLRSLVEALAGTAGVTVEEGAVSSVTATADGLDVDGATAPAVVLAMPDEQAARLLGEGLVRHREQLTRPSEPILALAAWWGARTWDGVVAPGPFHGAFVNGDDHLSWIADDGRRRGDDAPVLVAHSTPALAAANLEDPQAAGPAMLAALQRLLRIEDDPAGTYVQRWSVARPTGERDDPYLLTESGLGVCGDGWGGPPKVETAWTSGRDLGRALAARLG
ncbi:Renalase [Nocardioides aquaticus]|uniref:Renalase n=1 Tax=Nocardioides aquaticus TaxID=160826 RepID=A0ABX8EDE9_9ACTN|nr:NAD(P)-binding protein [Nocardioides aquaticus]QVT77915.1 Renalase [Nocardioides aquaticus]